MFISIIFEFNMIVSTALLLLECIQCSKRKNLQILPVYLFVIKTSIKIGLLKFKIKYESWEYKPV